MLSVFQSKAVICPVSTQKVDEKVVRILAATTVLLAIFGLWLNAWLFWIALALDFGIRAAAWNDGKSPLRWCGKLVAQRLALSPQYIDAAPKRFAAGVGVVFSLSIALTTGIGLPSITYLLGGILVGCACLEAAVRICIGCMVYTYLVIPFLNNK